MQNNCAVADVQHGSAAVGVSAGVTGIVVLDTEGVSTVVSEGGSATVVMGSAGVGMDAVGAGISAVHTAYAGMSGGAVDMEE